MFPSELGGYLNEVANRLGELGGTFPYDPVLELDWENRVGYLQAALTFHDGSRLEISITCSGPDNFPDWLKYRFHFMDQGDRCIFRYDNAEHYHETRQFPHHKHVGPEETPVDHPRPSLAQIVDEVRAHLYPEKPPAE